MKQKNLIILSLLTSLMLLIFAGSALADVTVKFKSATFSVGRTNQSIEMEVTSLSVPISMFDVVAEIAYGGTLAQLTGVSTFTLDGGTGHTDFTRMNGAPDDIFRIWAMDLGGCANVLNSGTKVAVTLKADVGCTPGVFTITPTGISWYIDPFTTATTTFLSGCAAQNVIGVIGTYTVKDNAPTFANCPTANLVFGCNTIATYDFDGDDIDLGFCGEALTFSMEPGEEGTIVPTTGVWSWPGSIGQVGTHNVKVRVTDSYGLYAICSFNVTITNQPVVIDYCPPAYTVPFDGNSRVWVCYGDRAFGKVTGHDLDNPVCPGPLKYFLAPAGFNGPGTFVLDQNTGDWSWQTDDEPVYAGIWHVKIGVTDQVDTQYCQFDIRVTGMEVKIGKTGEDELVIQGHYTQVPIYGFVDDQDVGGFEFLISYDASALNFIEATLGDYLADNDWEYFTYRKGPFGNCGGGCPSGLVSLIGINDKNDGPNHPNLAAWHWPDSIVIATLKFYVTSDRTYECSYIPIGFYWLSCGDNSMTDSTGNQLFLSRNVYWFDRPNDQYLLLDPTEAPYTAGWQSIPAPYYQDCVAILDPLKPFPLGCIDFYYGGVDIACTPDLDDRGDINLNGLAYDIGDAVLFTNYFIYGPSVFNINLQGQMQATDVNGDGKVLTVGDLVYLIRVITHDAVPYAKLAPFANSVDVNVVSGKIMTNTTVDIGAAYFVFNTDDMTAMPTLSATGMNMLSNYENGELRVLVYHIGTNSIPAGSNELLNLNTEGNLSLVRAELVDYNGADLTINARISVLPKQFAVSQNYPNPFNPSTDIMLSLPEASSWSIDIYNVNGQVVKSFSGHSNAGVITVSWDATGMASGIYFYKATIGGFSEVRKMVLMK